MAQAATPGGLGLPCSPKQALILYQHLFRHPTGLGQLQAALQQVQEGQACPSGLELPTVLLEIERSRRAQEQLLWDLELLTGAGLGLFWPPRAQFCGLRDQAQCEWSQNSELRGRMGAHSKQLMSGLQPRLLPAGLVAGPPLGRGVLWRLGTMTVSPVQLSHLLQRHFGQSSRLCSSLQTGDVLSQNHHFLEGGQATDWSSAPDPGEAGSDADPKQKSPGMPAEPTPGCVQGLDPTTSSSFREPGNPEFQSLVLKEEEAQAESETQRPLPLTSGSLRGRRVTQEATGPPGLSQSQDAQEGLGWSWSLDRAELQKLLGIEIPQNLREETPQGQGGEAPQGENEVVSPSQREKTNQGQCGEATRALRQEVSEGLGWQTSPAENKDAQDQKGNCPEHRRVTCQRLEVKILPSSGDRAGISQAGEVGQAEAPAQPQGIPEAVGMSLGEQLSQPGRRESLGPRGRSIQPAQDRTHGHGQEKALAGREQQAGREGALAPLRPRFCRSSYAQEPPMPTALSTGDSERQECPTALPGYAGLVHSQHGDLEGDPSPVERPVGEARGPLADGSVRFPGPLVEWRGAAAGPKTSKAAWPGLPGREKASVALSAAQRETALQRLLELQVAARRRRWQDREQQRLRVLDRLRIASNRLCRVHPLGPPPNPPQLLIQDPAGQRWVLREQLKKMHQERTRQLRALGARNTQNFQQLLCPPGAEEPAPGK